MKRVRGSLPKIRKNGLGNILKLETKSYMVAFQSNLLHMYFLMQSFRKEWNFLKCH